MKTIIETKQVTQAILAIQTLDLDPIKLKLMDTDEGYGWSRSQADIIEREYKRYLILLVKYPEEVLAPSKDVDKFWHYHILDTLKYANDCNLVFGKFLHHFPYFGMRGSEDAANLAAASKSLQMLYAIEFGSATSIEAAYCGAPARLSNIAYCGNSYTESSTAAYCGNTIATDKLNTLARPSLDRFS